MKSQYFQKTIWRWGSQIFIVYLNLNAPESTLMTFNLKQFM